jgi:hypothetical protein
VGGVPSFLQFLSAVFEGALAVRGQQALAGFDEGGKGGLGIGGHGEIEVGEALEILIIALGVEVGGGNGKEFRAGFR